MTLALLYRRGQLYCLRPVNSDQLGPEEDIGSVTWSNDSVFFREIDLETVYLVQIEEHGCQPQDADYEEISYRIAVIGSYRLNMLVVEALEVADHSDFLVTLYQHLGLL